MSVAAIIGQVLTILGALAFFIFGMKMMSDGIQRAAGSQLRNILRNMTRNRYLGVFTGFLITALVQSSSATTVMTVSFVNAGLLTLVESAGVMMGANIGTTVTAWIISIFGLEVSLGAYSIPIFAIALPMTFSSRGNLKYWGEFLMGFAILFLGLSELKAAVPTLDENSQLVMWLSKYGSYGFASTVFFVFVGALVTVIVQSSSAAMAVTLLFCYKGWIDVEVGAAMVLGENIGTTITAELASLVGNTNAKRSARIHSMFNIIGVTWMVILLPYVLDLISDFVTNFSDVFEGSVDAEKAETQDQILDTYKLAAFHTVFNIMNVLLMLPFVSWLVKMAIKTVPEKDGGDETSLKFIGTQSRTPELAIEELQKETEYFGAMISKMSGFSRTLINSVKSKEQKKMLKKLKKYEKNSDQMEIDITEYVTKLSNQEITKGTSIKMRTILNVCNDLERIADIYFQISKTMEQKYEDSIYFLPEQRTNINKMIDKIDEAFAVMIKNLSTPFDKVTIDDAKRIEKEINALRDEFRDENLNKLGQEDYNVKSAMIYNNVFSSLERVGDHIINVTEAVVGEI